MLLALSAEDGLLELFGVLYDVGGVLGCGLIEDLAELLLVLLVHCLYGCAVLGLRIYDGLVDDLLSGNAECLVGLHGLPLLVAVLRVDEVHALSQLA